MRWSVVAVCAVAGVASYACTAGDEPIDLACELPDSILQADGATPSGFVRCGDGFRHRAEAVACVVPPAPGTCDKGDFADACSSSATPPCEIVDGAWSCNLDRLCEDCG